MAEQTTKVITGRRTRWLYTNVWTPKRNENGVETYSLCLLIPKDDVETLEKIDKAVQEAYEAGKTRLQGNGKSVPAMTAIKLPLRDGDEERPDDENYSGMYFVNATSQYKPGIVDEGRNLIVDQKEVYSGCYGRASIVFYAYNSKGNKGIAAGLRNLQKIADGEKLDGGSSAGEDFAD